LALCERHTESLPPLGVGDRHPLRGDRDREVLRRVREPKPRKQVEAEFEAAPFLAEEILDRHTAVLERHLARDRGCPEGPDRARGEARCSLLDDKAADAAPACFRV